MAELGNQQALWQEFKAGNQSAFATLYRHLYSPLYFYALKATSDTDEARECVQELFVTLWKSRQRLGNVTRVKAYCFKSLRGIIRRSQSRRINQTPLTPDQIGGWTFSPEDFMIRQEDDAYRQDTLADVLNRLPPRQREAVYLKYYEGLSYVQVAEVLHINYQSAVNLIYQAFQMLKRQPVLRKLLTSYQWYPLLLAIGGLY